MNVGVWIFHPDRSNLLYGFKNIMDVSAEAPDDFPNFPLQKKSQFRSFEKFLQKGESYSNYMVGKRKFNRLIIIT